MKRVGSPLLILLLGSALLVLQQQGVSAVETTSLPSGGVKSPTASGTVCAQTVCVDPASGGIGKPQCPEKCKDSCVFVQNVCCPQQMVGQCSDDVPSGASSLTLVTSSAGQASSTASNSAATTAPSGSGISPPLPSSAQSSSASASGSGSATVSASESAAATGAATMSSSPSLPWTFLFMVLLVLPFQ